MIPPKCPNQRRATWAVAAQPMVTRRHSGAVGMLKNQRWAEPCAAQFQTLDWHSDCFCPIPICRIAAWLSVNFGYLIHPSRSWSGSVMISSMRSRPSRACSCFAGNARGCCMSAKPETCASGCLVTASPTRSACPAGSCGFYSACVELNSTTVRPMRMQLSVRPH